MNEQIAQFIENIANTWQKPVSLNYPNELRKIAAEIRKMNNEPRN